MSEETLSSEDRNAILGAVFNKPASPAPSTNTEDLAEKINNKEVKQTSTDICECGHFHTGKCSNKYCSCTEAKLKERKLESFGELLEKSLEKRQDFDKVENENLDEVKKELLSNVDFGIIKNWKW